MIPREHNGKDNDRNDDDPDGLLLPAAALVGAAFLVLADLLARSLLPPTEIPVGILTSASDVYTIAGTFTANDNARLIALVNKQVVASGVVSERDGRKTIDVREIRLAPTPGR